MLNNIREEQGFRGRCSSLSLSFSIRLKHAPSDVKTLLGALFIIGIIRSIQLQLNRRY